MRFKKILTFVFALILIATTTVQAAGLNVQMHVAHGWDPDQTTTVAEQMNSEWVRDEIRWRYVEWSKGSLNVPPTAAWVDKAVEKGMKRAMELLADEEHLQQLSKNIMKLGVADAAERVVRQIEKEW